MYFLRKSWKYDISSKHDWLNELSSESFFVSNEYHCIPIKNKFLFYILPSHLQMVAHTWCAVCVSAVTSAGTRHGGGGCYKPGPQKSLIFQSDTKDCDRFSVISYHHSKFHWQHFCCQQTRTDYFIMSMIGGLKSC